jgi:hypothetical protein
MNNKNKNVRVLYRGINEFKKGYKSRNNLVKDEDSHNILNGWRNHFSQLLNVHSVSDKKKCILLSHQYLLSVI